MSDERLYLIATEEVEQGNVDEALWAKAETLATGDPKEAKYQYIKLRVRKFKSASEAHGRTERDYSKSGIFESSSDAVGAAEQANTFASKVINNNGLGFWWWCIWGWLLLTIGNLLYLSLWQDLGENVIALLLINSTLAVFVLRLNKWAFLVSTIVSLNPIFWIVNGVYLRKRWDHPMVNKGFTTIDTSKP